MAIPVPMELVEAARAGGPLQIEQLVEAVWPDAYRLARAILGERQGAEDAAQEACIILYRSIATLRSSAAFRVWFYRIVVREASDLKRRRSQSEPISETLSSRTEQTESIDVWRALSVLPQHLRDVVVLRYFEDLSSREIGFVLGIPDATVRFHLAIARRRLRPLLDDYPPQFTHAANEERTNAIGL
jgi:RNA polymerase sigma-70 factor (ECF subfamily)